MRLIYRSTEGSLGTVVVFFKSVAVAAGDEMSNGHSSLIGRH